ncbi:MAG TPA: Rieske 2Fe-2S domain-containing protein [Terriglobales bacterium]|nr:Rieske 2Fe-2S domain-containing protein [Terriglobales bacterium]
MKSKFSKERRDLLKTTCALAGATAIGVAGGSLEAFAAGGRGTQPQPHGAPERHDLLVYTDGPKKGQEVMTADIVLDAPPVLVQAKDPETKQVRDSEKALVLLYRTSPDKIPADIRGDTWNGIIAYSALCTHQGCDPLGWDAESKQLLCPCHQGKFDPLQGGLNTGGPKTRDIPQIPVKDDEGKLIVSDAIMSWIGVKR